MWIDLPRRMSDLVVPYWDQYKGQSVALYQSVLDTKVSLLSAMELAGAMLLVFFLCLWDLSRSRKARDKQMDRDHGKHNKVLVQTLIADALTGANLKEGLHGPVLSDKDYRYWCKRFGCDLGFENLLVRKRIRIGTEKVSRLKKAIERRLGKEEPANIPGPKPGEDFPGAGPVIDTSLGEVFKRMRTKAA